MAAFDPDAWLAKRQGAEPSAAFDPDAWLAKRQGASTEPPKTGADLIPGQTKTGADLIPGQTAKAPEPTPAGQSIARQFADVPLKISGGAVTGVRMIADAFGADTDTSKNLRGVEDYIAALYSAQSKKDSKEIARIMDEVKDKGLWEQVGGGLKAASVAPVDLLSNALGTAAPGILAGLATIFTAGSPLLAAGITVGTGAIMGAGTIKGAIYDATKEILSEKTKMTPEEIEAVAVKAQEYKGENLNQILLGTGIGAIAGATGAEPAIARQLAKQIATRAAQTEAEKAAGKSAISTAVKDVTARETAQAAARGVVKHGAITGAKDLAGEALQGGQEQLAKNLAQQRLGFDVPTFQGVASQATLEGVAGLGMGAIGGGREAYKAKRELAAEQGEGKDYKELFTTAGEDKKTSAIAPTQDQLDLMNAATPAGSATGAPPAPPSSTPPPPPTTATTPTPTTDVTAKAQAYIDEGKPNTFRSKNLIKELGLDVPAGPGFNARAIEAIKAHLAQGTTAPAESTTVDRLDAQHSAAMAAIGAPSGANNEPTTVEDLATIDQLKKAIADAEKKYRKVENLESGNPKIKEAKAKWDKAQDDYTEWFADNSDRLDARTARVMAGIGAPSGTDTTAGGAGAGVDAAANPPINAPRPSGNPPGSVGGTGAATPANTVGAQATPPALTPEIQADIDRRRDEILDLVEEGANSRKITNKLNFLNKIEAQHGLELFKPTPDGLPARNQQYAAFPIAGSSDAAVSAAMKLADKYEKRDEEERQRLLGESRSERTPNIKVEDRTIENYNAKREEINTAADEHNSTRKTLADNLKNTLRALQEAELESERIDDQLEAAKQKGDEKAVLKLGEQANEVNRQAEDLVLRAADEEKALREHGGAQNKLPNWDKEITPVEKDVYLENILNDTPAEHEKAAKALLEYRSRQGIESREGEGTIDRGEKRLIKGYEDNREATSKSFGFKFPVWNKLSNAAKAAYFKEVFRNVGLQQDVGFVKVAKQIINENKELSAKQKADEISQLGRHQRRVRIEAERNRRKLERLNRDYNRTAGLGLGKGAFLPDNIVQMIRDNNVQGVLQYLRTNKEVGGPHKKVFKALSQALFQMKLDVKIRLVDSLPDGNLAEYDPSYKDPITGQIGLISVTPEGLTASTVLHEIVHAGTIKVLTKFLAGDYKSLTPEQIDACEQLQDIMDETKEAFAEYYPDAYKSLIEFVAYSLTEPMLQQDLATYESGDVIEATVLPDSRGRWTDFKLAIAGIVGAAKVYFHKGKVRDDAQVNYLLEVSAAMEDILAPQDEQIYLSENLPAKATKGGPKGLDNPKARAKRALDESEYPSSKIVKAIRDLYSRQGWIDKARKYVDKTIEASVRERGLDLGRLIIRDMSGAFNNFAEHMALASGEKLQFLTHYLDEPLTDLKQSFADYMKVSGKSFKEAMIDFHMLAEAFHEGERRLALFVQSVPLSEATTGPKALMQNGKMISAAARRVQILGDPSKGIPGLKDQVELTEAQQKQLWAELTNLAKNYGDPAGYTPREIKFKPKNPAQANEVLNMWNPAYSALGVDKKEVDIRKEQFDKKSEAEKKAIMAIFDAARAVSRRTTELNKIGNYWSFPVSNLTGMYNYEFYLPFKGVSKHTEMANLTDPNTMGQGRFGKGKGFMGKALQEIEHVTHGRFGVAKHPLLQLMSDGYRGADRAGRRNYTQAIKNAVKKNKDNPNGTGVIEGEVVKHIPYVERETVDLTEFKGGANIFHYNSDGSIDVIRIYEPKLLDALRYAFKEESPLLDLANDVTGWVGAMHTRYNINFAPKNFVTDMFTNAWNMGGGMMGPLAAPKYIGLVAIRVLQNGLGKAWEIALLNEKGDTQSQQLMINSAKKDPFVRDMLELIRFGGKTAYIESFSIKNNTEKLRRLEKSNWIADGKEGLDALLDTWSGMFELTSRTAAYSLFKEFYYNKEKEKGTSDAKGPNGEMSEAERAAATQAAAATKNLTNFEKVGEYGRQIGAAYMFIRPSAVSAARAIETVAPAFTTVNMAKRYMPKAVLDDKAAQEEYIKNFKKLRLNSTIMIGALSGMGYGLYLMAMMMAPDDDWKRNSVKYDNMEQWTRNARFHIPDKISGGKDVVIQIPWGFGLGAFPAIGAQIAGMVHGQATLKQGLGNIAGSILTDSFLPIPISRIPITTNYGINWAVDSLMPSIVRPVIEWLSNMNGIGQAINSATMRRMGDAFTGGDRIPEAYKDFAKWTFDKTNGKWDPNPNTMYFFTNSYIDGLARLGELGYNWLNLAKGEKSFSPKNDLPLFGSFFGSKPNVDAREFSKYQEEIKKLDIRIKTFEKTNRAKLADVRAEFPGAESAIAVYNQQNARLDKLHKRANEIRDMKIPAKDKEELLRLNITEQNMLKHSIIERMKGYGIEP